VNLNKFYGRIAAIGSAVGAGAFALVGNVRAAAPTLPDITDLYTAADYGDTIWDAVTKAAPFLLVLFGTLLVVSIGMALLNRALRGVAARIK